MLIRFYLLTAVVLWGWTFVASKIALDYMTPVELLGLRFLIGLPVLAAVIRIKRLSLKLSKQQMLRILPGSAIITAHFLIQITGIKYTSATNTGWIISVTPLVLALLSFLILKERLGRRELTGIGVATIGILILVSGGDLTELWQLSNLGDWLVLASAHTWALYTIATRDISRSHHPLIVTFAVMVPSAVVVLGYVGWTSDWHKFSQLPVDAVLAVLFLGVLGLAVAHWFWQEGVAEFGAARAGIFLYLEPIATTALAVPFLHEAFGFAAAIGGTLVLAGVFLAQRRKKYA